MKRVAWWVFAITTDFSLLLFVCSVVFWVRSYLVRDIAELETRAWWPIGQAKVEYHKHRTVADCSLGDLRVFREHSFGIGVSAWQVKDEKGGTQLRFRHYSPPKAWPRFQGFKYLVDRWGFQLGYVKQPQPSASPWGMDVVGGAAPMWGVVALFGVLPVIRVVLWMRRKPKREGKLCRKCGYDLRGSKERCPECALLIG